jgi:triacylglycerol esterase/lipase EstA (alpha/beta hydrolase family)
MLNALTPQRRRLLIGSVILGALVASAFALALVDGPRRETKGIPVLLVHGFGGTTSSMDRLEGALRGQGRRVVSVQLPRMGTGPIEQSSRAVADAVTETGARRVDLVGFSAGGVVVRAYIHEGGGATAARRVVLLGSPNHGAELAAFAASADPTTCVDACAQLSPGSSFLGALNDGDETPDGPDYTSIWTANDRTVTPPESAILEGASNVRVQDVCSDSGLGHSDLVNDPLAIGLVLHALAGQRDATCDALRSLGAEGA